MLFAGLVREESDNHLPIIVDAICIGNRRVAWNSHRAAIPHERMLPRRVANRADDIAEADVVDAEGLGFNGTRDGNRNKSRSRAALERSYGPIAVDVVTDNGRDSGLARVVDPARMRRHGSRKIYAGKPRRYQ
jgi:hypothetical protein